MSSCIARVHSHPLRLMGVINARSWAIGGALASSVAVSAEAAKTRSFVENVSDNLIRLLDVPVYQIVELCLYEIQSLLFTEPHVRQARMSWNTDTVWTQSAHSSDSCASLKSARKACTLLHTYVVNRKDTRFLAYASDECAQSSAGALSHP